MRIEGGRGGGGKRMEAKAVSSEPVGAVAAEEGQEEKRGRKTPHGANTVT